MENNELENNEPKSNELPNSEAENTQVESSDVTETVEETVTETVEETVTETVEETVTETEEKNVEETETETLEESVTEPVADTIAETVTASVVETSTNNKPAKEKKKGGKGILVAIIAAVVAIVAIVSINIKTIGNFCRKTFWSPEKYFQYVAEQNASQKAEYYTNMYSSMYYDALISNNSQSEVGFTLSMTEDGYEYIEDLADMYDLDYEDISNIGVTYSVKHKEQYMESTFNFNLGKNDILSVDMIFDKENLIVYLGVPSISNSYMSIDLEDVYDDYEIENIETVFEFIDKLDEASPSPEVVNKIISKYLTLVIKQINDVEKSTEVIEANGVSEKVTALDINITEETIQNIFLAVFTEIKDDEDIKNIVFNISEAIDEEFDMEDTYDDAMDELEDAIELLEDDEWLEGVDEADFENFDIVIYVNKYGDVCGSYVSFETERYDYNKDKYVTDDNEIFYAYTQKNGKFGFEAYATAGKDELFSLTGEGKISGMKFTGEFELEIEDESVSFELIDMDFEKATQGIYNGEIKIEFDQFKDYIPRSLRDFYVSIVLKNDGNNKSAVINLGEDDTVLFVLTFFDNNSNKTDISVPNSKNVTEVEDMDDVADFFEDLDYDNFVDLMEDYGIEDFDDFIDELIDYLPYVDMPPCYAFLIPIYEVRGAAAGTTAALTGIIAPQLYKYIEHAKESNDEMLKLDIELAIQTVLTDPSFLADDCYYDVYYDLYYGVDITSWGKPSNYFEIAVADILGIEDFDELNDMVQASNYYDGGIYVYLTEYGNDVEVDVYISYY